MRIIIELNPDTAPSVALEPAVQVTTAEAQTLGALDGGRFAGAPAAAQQPSVQALERNGAASAEPVPAGAAPTIAEAVPIRRSLTPASTSGAPTS